MVSMISDDNFRTLLDKALKAQNIKKKERDKIINDALLAPVETRNDILDKQEGAAWLAKQKKAINSEAQEQKDLVAWFKATYPDKKIMMIRNDGYRTFSERPEQLLMGLLPGAADLYIPHIHTWIEMKRSDGGAGQSDVQKEFEAYVVNECGDRYLLCNGFDDAKRKINLYIY